MNMVTKSGGNRFTSDHNFYFMNDALQGNNVDDDLLPSARAAARVREPDGRRRQPGRDLLRLELDAGRPDQARQGLVLRRVRFWRLDQLQIGARNPDGSQAIDDNDIRNMMGKVTWQTTDAMRTSLMFNRNVKNRYHRRDSPYLFVEDKATVLQDQPAQNFVAQYNHVLGRSMVLDARIGSMWGVVPEPVPGRGVGTSDIALRDVQTFQRFNAAEIQSLNPNYRVQANGTLSYFLSNFAGGSHDLKGGLQLSWEKMEYERIRNGDILLEMRTGVPFQGQIANTPINSDHRLETWGAFIQDRWTLGRATINVGLRYRRLVGHTCRPRRARPAPTWASGRSTRPTSTRLLASTSRRRLGISYDLFGNGKTALKAYYGRFYNQFGSEIVETANRNALATLNAAWADADGDRQLDPGELTSIPTFTAGLFPTVDSELRPAVQRRDQRRHRAPDRAEPGRRRQLPPPPAPQRPRRRRPGPADQRLHAGAGDLHRRGRRRRRR